MDFSLKAMRLARGAVVLGAVLVAACSASTTDKNPEQNRQFGFVTVVQPSVAQGVKKSSGQQAVPGKKKQAALAKKRKLAEAKRRLAAEQKRLASYDKMLAALTSQQRTLLKPQRDAIEARVNTAAKEVGKLTPKPKVTQSRFGKNGTKGRRYHSLIATHARANGIPLKLAHAVVRVESSYRANARGAAGEIGLMQIKLSTARLMGYRGSARGLYDPATNLKYGMKYLGKARRLAGGSTCGTILRYNAGHGAKRMNPISARYCRRVKRYI